MRILVIRIPVSKLSVLRMCMGVRHERRSIMRPVSLPITVSLILLCVASNAAIAADLPAPATAKAVPANHTDYVAGFGQSADLGTLEKFSGGTDISNRITLHGDVSNNNTDHTVTGNNSIGSGAFSGSVGLPMVIQNSGNSVLIQNATIVSVQFQP
jgi:hypothetical protein